MSSHPTYRRQSTRRYPPSVLLEQLMIGLTLGCLYALIALGYTLIFGIIQVIFFAQGELVMVSAFIAIGAVSLLSSVGSLAANSWVVVLVVLLACVAGTIAVGVTAERIALRPIRKASRTKQLITSLGVSIVLQNLFFLFISSGNESFPALISVRTFVWYDVTVNNIQLFIIGTSVLLMILIDVFVQRTRLGLAMRATAESHRLSQLMGINVNRTITLTFVVGSALAAFAGIMMGLYDGVAKYDMGFVPGIKAFTAAILGGIGNVRGGMLGGLLIGLVETFAAGYISAEYKDFFAFAILIAVLVVKPSGLLGERVATS